MRSKSRVIITQALVAEIKHTEFEEPWYGVFARVANRDYATKNKKTAVGINRSSGRCNVSRIPRGGTLMPRLVVTMPALALTAEDHLRRSSIHQSAEVTTEHGNIYFMFVIISRLAARAEAQL